MKAIFLSLTWSNQKERGGMGGSLEVNKGEMGGNFVDRWGRNYPKKREIKRYYLKPM